MLRKLTADLRHQHRVNFVYNQKDIVSGDCAFFLGCGRIVKKNILKKNKHNLMVHESASPQGRDWSPLTRQILARKNNIPITLFKVGERVDSGDIYFQEMMHFEGHELNVELKNMQGKKTIKLVKKFIRTYPHVIGKK